MAENESYTNIFNSDNDTSISTPSIYQFVGLTELFVAIFATPMNAFVLFAACSRRKGMTLKSRRTITECLVISMSTADLIFSALHSPLSFVYFYLGSNLDKWQCQLFYTVSHVSTIASSLSLLWLNINKFLQLHRPLHYFLYMTKRRALVFIAIGWSVSIVWGVFFVFGPFIRYDEICNARLHYPELYIFFASEFFVLPTFVSLFISADVALLVVNEKRNRFRARFPSGSSRPTLRRSRTPQQPSHHQKQKSTRDQGNIRKVKFVFATTIWSAITVLPYRIAYIIHNLPGFQATDVGVSISFCLFALMALNAAGNPFITLLTHKQYANQILHRFRCSKTATRGRDQECA